MSSIKSRNKTVLFLLNVVLPSILLIFDAPSSRAGGKPEYMKLDYQKIPAVEIKGVWDDKANVFVATDIEELPQPRRPKLRGTLQAIDLEKETITLYGIPIEIDQNTQFLDAGEKKLSIRDLKVGQWMEITCNVEEDSGEWEARKIKFKDIKQDNKIKGTLTRISVDGVPPDTLEIYGLLIILNKETDVNYPSGSSLDNTEEGLFDILSQGSPMYSDEGIPAGDIFLFGGEFRQSVGIERDYDLSSLKLSDQDDVQPEVRLELAGYFNDHLRSFAQFRLRDRVYMDSERLDPPSKKIDSKITQLFVLARDVGLEGLSLQLGRQVFEEPREWLFDEYLDGARLYYYAMTPLILDIAYIHSDFQLKKKYRTWTDMFAEARWQLDKRTAIRGYLLSRKDSDALRRREPVYLGVGYNGRFGHYLRPWVELAIMRGHDKGRKLDASAFDMGTTVIAENLKFSPSVNVGYAGGSGDKSGDNVDNEFRQTGYEDNVGYFGGVTTLHYYGDLLDPELSNLKILTLGMCLRPIRNMSLDIIYHTYRQDVPDNNIRGNLADPPATPLGISPDIGWGLDFTFGLANLWNRAYLVWTYAIFNPGDAFPPFFTRTATSNSINLKIDL